MLVMMMMLRRSGRRRRKRPRSPRGRSDDHRARSRRRRRHDDHRSRRRRRGRSDDHRPGRGRRNDHRFGNASGTRQQDGRHGEFPILHDHSPAFLLVTGDFAGGVIYFPSLRNASGKTNKPVFFRNAPPFTERAEDNRFHLRGAAAFPTRQMPSDVATVR